MISADRASVWSSDRSEGRGLRLSLHGTLAPATGKEVAAARKMVNPISLDPVMAEEAQRPIVSGAGVHLVRIYA